MQKQVQFKIKGMNRDLSESAFNAEYSYENMNIRITATDNNTMLSVTNERGNKQALIKGVTDNELPVPSLNGIPIGQATIDKELILFTTYNNSKLSKNTIKGPDNIYKLWFEGKELNGELLYNGSLNFDAKHPIEALAHYENDLIKKVYWTDGINPPRIINIEASKEEKEKWNDDYFNFIPTLKLEEEVTITRNLVANGIFAPGVIQYAFTYYNKYGQESNIFYTSPLYYISYNNRGASPEDKVGNSFTINVKNTDNTFDYVRVYSIHRTSLDATPKVKRVADLSVSNIVGAREILEPVESKLVSLPPEFNNFDKVTIYEDTNIKRRLKSYPYVSYVEAGTTIYQFTLIEGKDYFFTLSGTSNSYCAHNLGKKKLIVYYKISPTGEVIITVDSGEGNLLEHGESYKTLNAPVTYIDNGTTGEIIDPTELLYVGGEEVIFKTLTQKDNTLFLGNIDLNRDLISKQLKIDLQTKGTKINFELVPRYYSPDSKGFYPYENQLKTNSNTIKIFKYLETYRLGVQFQHYTGKWSEPIWLGDFRNNKHVVSSYGSKEEVKLPEAVCDITNRDSIKSLAKMGYKRARPVIVYPTLTDRECICQGILCPTVYNVSDRYGNSPFVQSSWFTRANAPFDYKKSFEDWGDRNNPLKLSIDSRAGVLRNDAIKISDSGNATLMEEPLKGAVAEFRHNYPIPSNDKRNAEIQCINYAGTITPTVDINNKESDTSAWVVDNAENFFIDQSIVTMHSPDIEFNDLVRSVDTSGLKLRIVGIVPLTSFIGDIDIQTSTPPLEFKGTKDIAPGFYKEPIEAENISRFGFRGLMSGAFWLDEIAGTTQENSPKNSTGFVVYPFHRNGSLNNTKVSDKGYKSALLDKKKLSNLRYSYNTYFLNTDKVWNAYIEGNDDYPGISGVSIFDSNEVSLVRIPSPENSNLPDLNYYGNVDKVITVPRTGNKKDGYPIVITGAGDVTSSNEIHKIFISDYQMLNSKFSTQNKGIDPIRMKYKSTPHAVMALNYTKNKVMKVLPSLKDGIVGADGNIDRSWEINVITPGLNSNSKLFWEDTKNTFIIYQDVIENSFAGLNNSNTGYGPEYGWLWLGELYNDNVVNRFGGTSEEAIENNLWVPCGEPVSLYNNGVLKTSLRLNYEEGDTYYQRYDHIKTYPFTLEDQNAITDIVSFMCETRVNLDGRYDRNRGQTNNFAITPENFNKMNNVYSQTNNFFNYRAINLNKINLDNFHNTITWTKTKVAGELVDTWTNITLANTLDLDGDKGPVNAIRRFNNSLIAFQNTGISQILYNENVQIASTEGVPIEIANSAKVQGKRYITDKVGSINKWSICETPSGLFFVDDITKAIYLFNGQLNNISDNKGFHSWINKESTMNVWNPVDFSNIVTYYDKANGDILFINKNQCLAYSELFNNFSSFYSYNNIPYISTLQDKGISFKANVDNNTEVWLQNEGDYNMFYGAYKPFYATYLVNPDMPLDKIFNNLEFRADSWDNDILTNKTFDTLEVWNEYQRGISNLSNTINRPSSLKKKFRIWRVNIPRDTEHNLRDRMRNPWIYLKLSMNNPNTYKTVLHDMIVSYYV